MQLPPFYSRRTEGDFCFFPLFPFFSYSFKLKKKEFTSKINPVTKKPNDHKQITHTIKIINLNANRPLDRLPSRGEYPWVDSEFAKKNQFVQIKRDVPAAYNNSIAELPLLTRQGHRLDVFSFKSDVAIRQQYKQFLQTLNDNNVNANERRSSHSQSNDEISTPPLSNEAQALKLLIDSLLRKKYYPSALKLARTMHGLVNHSTVEELLDSFNNEEEQLEQSTKKNKTKK